jgi:hypothetical protein
VYEPSSVLIVPLYSIATGTGGLRVQGCKVCSRSGGTAPNRDEGQPASRPNARRTPAKEENEGQVQYFDVRCQQRVVLRQLTYIHTYTRSGKSYTTADNTPGWRRTTLPYGGACIASVQLSSGAVDGGAVWWLRRRRRCRRRRSHAFATKPARQRVAWPVRRHDLVEYR